MAKIQKAKMITLVSGVDVLCPIHFGARAALLPGKPTLVDEGTYNLLSKSEGFKNLTRDRANGKGPMIKVIRPLETASEAN